MPAADQSVAFFKQLEEFSRRYLSVAVKAAAPLSPWGGKAPIRLKGAVIHYTADQDMDRVLRWFNDPRRNAQVSAHVVVADRQLGSQARLTLDLPLVAELPATVVQCRRPNQQAWHGSWSNAWAYGIECVSAGELRTPDEGQSFTSWRPCVSGGAPWSAPWVCPYKSPVKARGRWWDPFSAPQVASVVTVLRYLRDLPEVALHKPYVLGHEQVQGVGTVREDGSPMRTDKRDPGPTCPLHGIREAVFDGWLPLYHYEWFQRHRNDALSEDAGQQALGQRLAQLLSGSTVLPSASAAWERCKSALQAHEFGVWGKFALHALGYYMPSVLATDRKDLESALNSDEWTSVWLFQRMMGIATDGMPGPQTCRALLARLKDRGLI